MSKTIEILIGIPCSGKSTYCKSQEHCSYTVSRDYIREHYFPQPYSYRNEKEVTKIFDTKVDFYLKWGEPGIKIILDNTHCKDKYIDEVIKKYPEYNIIVKYFECSLLKAHYRNIIRYYKTRKWIPVGVINQMFRNFKNVNRQKYKKYEDS